MDRWTERKLDAAQSAMFDVMLDQIVPSLKEVDRELKAKVAICPNCEGRGSFCRRCMECGEVFID